MTDALGRLMELVPPPDDPLHIDGDWEAVEQALELQLPEDYKQFISLYGAGGFMGHEFRSGIHIVNYLGPVPPRLRAEKTSSYFTLLEAPFDVYPKIPGLLYAGTYKDVDKLAWLTNENPSQWTIVYQDVETDSNEIKGMGIVEFVVSVLEETSSLVPDIIGRGEMAGPHTFQPGT